ncbi:MAG TPA: twin-arginine translocase TatA/TatE family subunit [Candidatus Binataceae bacterium]|nr:twin-arginine translocase TatA/TatE family subunit [Candidatus Binataceae bacterium]
MGDLISPSHLLLLLVIVLVIFGPSKLGDVGSALGRAIRDFKREMNPETQPPAQTKPTANAEPPAIDKPVNPS